MHPSICLSVSFHPFVVVVSVVVVVVVVVYVHSRIGHVFTCVHTGMIVCVHRCVCMCVCVCVCVCGCVYMPLVARVSQALFLIIKAVVQLTLHATYKQLESVKINLLVCDIWTGHILP